MGKAEGDMREAAETGSLRGRGHVWVDTSMIVGIKFVFEIVRSSSVQFSVDSIAGIA